MPEIVTLHVRLDYGWITYVSDAFFYVFGPAHENWYLSHMRKSLMRGSKKFCQRGSNFGKVFFFFFFFQLMSKGRIQIQPHMYKRASLVRQCANDCPTLDTGLVAL